MRRLFFMFVLGTAITAVFFAFVTFAQEQVTASPNSLIVDIRQTVPVTAAVAVPIDNGTHITTMLPLTIELAGQISIVGFSPAIYPISRTYTLTTSPTVLPGLADMPDGFQAISTTVFLSNEDWAGDASELLVKAATFGRLGSYSSNFRFAGLPLFTNAAITTDIIIFRDHTGAQAYLTDWLQRMQQSVDAGTYTAMHPLSAPTIGDFSYFYKFDLLTLAGDNPERSRYVLYTRYQNALIYIEIIAFKDGGDPLEALRLARGIIHRLQALSE